MGLKTTNAKTKAFHIPPPQSAEDAPDKSHQKSASASARKGRPRVSHAEMTKLDIHGDIDQLKEMDIEYMPPPPKSNGSNLPAELVKANCYQISPTTLTIFTRPTSPSPPTAEVSWATYGSNPSTDPTMTDYPTSTVKNWSCKNH